MSRDFPFLNALASEIDKVGFEIEDEARSIIQEDLPKLREKKATVMAAAKAELTRQGDLMDKMNEGLNKIITAVGGNSGNPTSQGS
jgi:hypothetical protein